MNKILQTQTKNYFKDQKLSNEMLAFLEEIDKTYENYERSNINIQKDISQQFMSQNLELLQDSNSQKELIENLKAAIATLEPHADILSNNLSFEGNTTFLMNSLLKLIDTKKKSEEVLRKHTEELEVLNTQLFDEKDKLTKERAKDQAVLRSIADGLVVTNLYGQIVLINYAFTKILGWKTEEVIGKIITDVIKMVDESNNLVNPKHRVYPIIPDKDKIVIKPEKTYYYVRRDGSKFPVVMKATPIIILDKIVGSVEVFSDISKEKEIENSKNEFVALASHQLRTPLSATNWYTELLLDEDAGAINDEQKMYIEEIMKANARMTSMVNDLLNISRIELGTFSVKPLPTNIIEVTEKILNELFIRINNRKINFQRKYQPNLPLITVDTKLLDICIENLLTNAIKYTPENGNAGIEIFIGSLGDNILKSNEEYAIIKVWDSGYGIPTKDQQKIFTKLYRASNILKKDTDGNGLGLYITKKIIEETGGKIWFISEEDKGTQFFIALPTKGMNTRQGTKELS
ncbi:PAS domain S-box protein [Candidatus Dojkabacteria bacterium]|nr:PAS domain S-box protein [Candidatus Dojkabacteria bacterium]